MGILRNIAKAIATFFFSLFLALFLITFLFYNVTSYNTSKEIFTTVFKNILLENTTNREIEEVYSSISSYCKVNTNITLPIDNMTLSCSEILDKDVNTLINIIAEKFFEKFYYKSYECDFLECVKNIRTGEDFAVFFSLKAHNFFERLIWPLLAITIGSGIALFFLIETWSGRFKIFGFEFLSIGIFFFLLPYFKDFAVQKIPKDIPAVENILNTVLNQLSSILLIFFILGIIFVSAWVLIKIFGKKSKSK
jgi:hypothetical protein